MSGREVDPELLGRLAERLEETGRALKSISVQVNQVSHQVSSLDTKVESAHARLKTIEHIVNGNGGKGIKTELELAKKDIENVEGDVQALVKWKENVGDRKITDLKDAQEKSQDNTRNTFLTLLAVAIALGSMISSCGPQWLKAMSAKPPSSSNG